jgi:uncharacterized protein YecE (DUF72 family)
MGNVIGDGRRNLEPPNLRIGTAGWSYPDWDGVVYPDSRPRGFDALEYLSSYFSVIEINSTFYRTPSPSICRNWARRTPPPPRFSFTVKALQDFTHSTGPLDGMPAFRRAIAPLADEDKLSAVLVQFPWSLRDGPEARRRIDEITAALSPLPVALEVRHGSWDRPGARAWLAATGHSVCGIDQPVIGQSVEPGGHIAGSAGTYLRLHGRNYRDWFRDGAGRDARYDYLYSAEELAPWVETIRRAAASSTTTVILNNHFRGQAPANGFELMAALSGTRVPAPAPLRRAFPRLENATTPGFEAAGESAWLFDD